MHRAGDPIVRCIALLASMAPTACIYPATEVQVLVGTDIDPSLPLTVTARVTRDEDAAADPLGHTWQRSGAIVRDASSDPDAIADADDAPSDAPGDAIDAVARDAMDAVAHDAPSDAADDAMDAVANDAMDAVADDAMDAVAPRDAGLEASAAVVAFPFTFAVIPGDGPVGGRVHLFIEANAAGVVFRRQSAFSFLPHQRLTLPVFLSNRCAQPASGVCPGTGSGPCIQARFCEENNLTCGDDGQCVAIETTPGDDPDASFGDVSHPVVCGAYGQVCCTLGDACQSPLSCVANRCQRCTDAAEVCCTGPDLRPDGARCADATDACHDASTCSAGACVAGGARPDGTSAGGGDRCCSGHVTSMLSSHDCNACGLSCGSGSCQHHASIGQNLCACTATAQCPSGFICRSSSYPDGHTCVPSNGVGVCTHACPGGSHCQMGNATVPDYCTY